MSSTKIEFAVQMTCGECVNAVEKCLQSVPEIKSFDVNLQNNSVIVDTTLGVEEVKKKLESTGRKVVVKGAGGQAGVAILDIGDKGIQGVVRFVQNSPNTCVVDGTVDGLNPGKHGLAIHECGDVSNGCNSVGNFYDPENSERNGRIYGNLGVIEAKNDGRAEFRLEDNVIKISDIIGRALVITEDIKDSIPFGRRLACGIIARSSGLFQNPKTICACDGVSIWDERKSPKSAL